MIEAPGEKNTSTNVVIHVGAIFQHHHHPVTCIRNGNVFLLRPNKASQNLWDIWSKTMTSTCRAHLQAKVEETDVFQEITYQEPRWSKLPKRTDAPAAFSMLQSSDPHVVRRRSRLWTSCPWNPRTVQQLQFFFVGITWSIEILRWKQRILFVNSFKPDGFC